MGRRDFGSTRKLPSGRWQAGYWHEGKRHVADRTFAAKADATAWLSTVEADIVRGGWIDPAAGRATLADYAVGWLDRRPDIRPSTRAKYRGLLDLHILPTLGATEMAKLRPSQVRAWWAELAAEKPATAAGAYRLLSTICRTAVADQVIVRSPCQVKGGGVERSAERPVATVAELDAAVNVTEVRWRLALLLAGWCQLRRGEVMGLQRRDLDLLHGTLRVERAFIAYPDGTTAIGPPKTDAGVRSVAMPANVVAEAKRHLAAHVGADPESWLFPGQDGQPASVMTLERAWAKARKAIGRSDLRLHDLRHSGLTWAAATGASTAELMRRAGHASPQAALRYQHATEDRDRALADALGDLAAGKVTPLAGRRRNPSRTNRARRVSGSRETEQSQRDSNPCSHLERVMS